MGKNKRKSFQSGREVMKTYVPEYRPRPVADTEERRMRATAHPVEEVAANLLRDFTARLKAKTMKRPGT